MPNFPIVAFSHQLSDVHERDTRGNVDPKTFTTLYTIPPGVCENWEIKAKARVFFFPQGLCYTLSGPKCLFVSSCCFLCISLRAWCNYAHMYGLVRVVFCSENGVSRRDREREKEKENEKKGAWATNQHLASFPYLAYFHLVSLVFICHKLGRLSHEGLRLS